MLVKSQSFGCWCMHVLNNSSMCCKAGSSRPEAQSKCRPSRPTWQPSLETLPERVSTSPVDSDDKAQEEVDSRLYIGGWRPLHCFPSELTFEGANCHLRRPALRCPTMINTSVKLKKKKKKLLRRKNISFTVPYIYIYTHTSNTMGSLG